MNALQPSSGTQAFNPTLGDFVIEAYGRIQVRPPSLTADHFFQARMSANLLFSEWANIGMPLLWKQALLQIPLIPGVATYTLPRNVIAPLDAFVRQYQAAGNAAANFAPSFTADVLSTSLQVRQVAHGLGPGQMVWYATQVNVSGVILQGTQLVTSIIDQDNYELTLPTQTDGTNSATLPSFSATLGSSVVAVHFPAHGQFANTTFLINVPVTVGGILLQGAFQVLRVTGPDDFTIQAPAAASASQAGVLLNGGQVQTQTQAFGVDPIDYILYPLSRNEYAAQPDKQQQYRPTTFWVSRTVPPIVNFWNVPDNNGPYVLNLWVMQQNDDAAIEGGIGVDVPSRWFQAFASGLAARLAQKFPPAPPNSAVLLEGFYKEQLEMALREDIERGPAFYIQPGISGYWR